MNNIHYGHQNQTPRHDSIECIVDSGCTKHYLKSHENIHQNENQNPLHVMLPNGHTMTSTATTALQIHSATTKGNQAHIFQDLASGNILSVGQLCDDDYEVTFTKNKVLFDKDNDIKFSGQRNPINGMWMAKFPIKHQVNVIIPYKPMQDAIKFMHAACFSPCISTWCNAIRQGYFSTWPGLTAAKVTQYIKQNPEATVKGHLTRERKNMRSTRSPNLLSMSNQISEMQKPEINEAYIKIEFANPAKWKDRAVYSDLTGRFPQRSNRGNQYIFLLYDTTSNHIFVEPLKDRTSKQIQTAYKAILAHLHKAGIKPKIHILDNEASKEYATLIEQVPYAQTI